MAKVDPTDRQSDPAELDQADLNQAGPDQAQPPHQQGPQPLALPAGRYQLCSCGRSRHGWFCDGAHLGTGLVAHDLQLEEDTTLLLCGCGRSRRYPLCDGHHRQPQRRAWWAWWR